MEKRYALWSNLPLFGLPGYSLTACIQEGRNCGDFYENHLIWLSLYVCRVSGTSSSAPYSASFDCPEVLPSKKKGMISLFCFETEFIIPVIGISAYSDIKRLKSGIFSALDKNIPSSENTNSPKISACSLPDSRVCAQEASRLYHATLQSDRTSHTNKDLLLDKLFTGKFTGITSMLLSFADFLDYSCSVSPPRHLFYTCFTAFWGFFL